MRIRSLSLKVALLGGAALTAVFAIGMTLLVQQVGGTMEAQTRQLQAETTEGIAAQVSTDLLRGERAAEGIVTALQGLHTAGVKDRAVYDATIRQFLERNPGLLGAWSGLLGSFTTTQHLLSNYLVDVEGDTAVATAMFQATHRMPNEHGGPLWILGGRYRFDLARTGEGWRIGGVEMTATWADGNQHLLARAAEAQSGRG